MTRLPVRWTCVGPATFARDDGWLVSVDDTTAETLIGHAHDGEHEAPTASSLSPREAIGLIDRTHPRESVAA